VSVPNLTNEQLAEARLAAAAARRQRADFKARVQSGELRLAKALDIARKDDILAHIRVSSLLRSLPRVGEKRAAQILSRLDIAPNRRIRGLGRHQLEALSSEFS
jgi:ribosomal protein S13